MSAREAPEHQTQPDRQRTPAEIQADIEATRDEVGDTVEALAAKTDVKARAQDRIDTIKSNLRAKTDDFGAKAKDATPADAQHGGRQIVATVRAHPAPVAIAAAALFGFLLSRLTDRRR